MLLMFSSLAVAREFEKIPIEQAIKESREHREQERLAKAQRLAKQRESQEQLGIMGALPTQYQYDVKFYRIALNVNVTTEIIVGRVDMTSTATQDNVTFCQVDLYSNLTVDSVELMAFWRLHAQRKPRNGKPSKHEEHRRSLYRLDLLSGTSGRRRIPGIFV